MLKWSQLGPATLSLSDAVTKQISCDCGGLKSLLIRLLSESPQVSKRGIRWLWLAILLPAYTLTLLIGSWLWSEETSLCDLQWSQMQGLIVKLLFQRHPNFEWSLKGQSLSKVYLYKEATWVGEILPLFLCSNQLW